MSTPNGNGGTNTGGTNNGGHSYVGAPGSISAADVPALFEGAKFYSPAVGDANKSSLTSWLEGLLDRNGPVPLRRARVVFDGVTARKPVPHFRDHGLWSGGNSIRERN